MSSCKEGRACPALLCWRAWPAGRHGARASLPLLYQRESQRARPPALLPQLCTAAARQGACKKGSRGPVTASSSPTIMTGAARAPLGAKQASCRGLPAATKQDRGAQHAQHAAKGPPHPTTQPGRAAGQPAKYPSHARACTRGVPASQPHTPGPTLYTTHWAGPGLAVARARPARPPARPPQAQAQQRQGSARQGRARRAAGGAGGRRRAVRAAVTLGVTTLRGPGQRAPWGQGHSPAGVHSLLCQRAAAALPGGSGTALCPRWAAVQRSVGWAAAQRCAGAGQRCSRAYAR
jgi:hypothetical protein